MEASVGRYPKDTINTIVFIVLLIIDLFHILITVLPHVSSPNSSPIPHAYKSTSFLYSLIHLEIWDSDTPPVVILLFRIVSAILGFVLFFFILFCCIFIWSVRLIFNFCEKFCWNFDGSYIESLLLLRRPFSQYFFLQINKHGRSFNPLVSS